MKKAFCLTALASLVLSLTGCTVNWFGAQYDVPWYFIAVPVAIVFIIAHVRIMSATYVCPECKTEFKPKWYQILAYVHFMDKRLNKCPNCKKINYCKKKQ